MSSELQESVGIYRIRPGVAKVRRERAVILVSRDTGTSVRVSPAAEHLMPLLATGARFDELVERLREAHPAAGDVASKLSRFLGQLVDSGLLEGTEARAKRGLAGPRLVLCQPDRFAAAVARPIAALPAVLAWGMLGALIVAAAAGIAMGAWHGQLPHPSALVTAFDPIGLALFVLVVIPLHEAAHAVACRLAGVEVGPAGLLFHGWLIPGPYVDTSQAYRIPRRWKRFWIPAAGPTVNLLAAGAAAWLLFAAAGPAGIVSASAAGTLFLLSVLFVYLDTNPLSPSDGSHMLEAVLDDELARQSALSRRRSGMSHWKTVVWYRGACSTHVQLAAVIAYFWWAGLPF